MPRLSACIEMIFRDLPFTDRIAAAKAAGLDTVEFWGWRNKDLDVIVLRDMKYAGFLDSRTLLNVVSERNLAAARDQNANERDEDRSVRALPGSGTCQDRMSRPTEGGKRNDDYYH